MPVIEGADMNMDRRGGVLGLWIVGMLLLGASCVEPKEFTPLPPSVPQLRLPRNDVYEGSVITGALRPTFVWEPSTFTTGGPLHYELQYSADPDLADAITIETSEPTFRPSDALPVSTVPPVGRRYYWHVRACIPAICSDYSPTWWVNLGRSNKDFNGDGYADVAVGNPQHQNRGAFYVYFGGQRLPTIHNTVIGYSSGNDNFGVAISPAGDFNADGYSDIIVGAPGALPNGRAYIYFGGPGETMDKNFDVNLPGISANEGFGRAVSSAGDLDADGFSDVVVGAPSNEANGYGAGRAYIFYGGNSGVQDLPGEILVGKKAGEGFGGHVSPAGDLDGDGFADLAITSGDFLEVTSAPCFAQVFRGSARDAFVDFPALRLEGRTNTECSILAASGHDINRDGFADLLVATAPSSSPFATIYLGNSNISNLSEINLPPSLIGNRSIGSVASAGDVNGDGLSDILVGGANFNPEATVQIFLGSGANVPSAAAATLRSTAGTGSSFGQTLGSTGDINGDGFDDIVVGSYGDAVYVYLGNAGGSIDTTADMIWLPPSTGLYGYSLL
jgi:FG-GAP repeat/FG-GAP-like repeat